MKRIAPVSVVAVDMVAPADAFASWDVASRAMAVSIDVMAAAVSIAAEVQH